jgi:glycosyltransferase involved in cell wall biosynthesis
MRVIIIADYGIAEGGAPQVAIASAIALAEAGHEVIFIQGVGGARGGVLDAHPGIRRFSLGGRDIWSKSMLVGARDGIWNRAARMALRDMLVELSGPDSLVHVHQWTKFFSPSVFAAIFDSGLPLVVTLHDYFLSCPTGLMYRFDQKRPCALTPLSTACMLAPCDPKSRAHKAIRVLRGLAVKKTLQGRSFAALHVSDVGRESIGRFLPEGASQFVVENPIECQDHGLRAEPVSPKLVYCGRLTEEKGVLLVAKAAREAQVPSLFIGEGPMREAVLAIDPEAEITGWMERDAVRRRIAKDALALVAPSLWPETGPMVVAEALASGVPVIASVRAGAAGRVEHGRTGFVVEPKVGAILSAVRELQNVPIARAMGREAYRRFWANPPGPAKHAASLAEIYAQSLAAHHRA